MSRFMYGVEFLREFNPEDPDHLARKDRICELPSGPKLLADAFDCILSRVCDTALFRPFPFVSDKVLRESKLKSQASSPANIAQKSRLFPPSQSLRWRSGVTAVVQLSRCGSIATRKILQHYALSRRICLHSRVVPSQSREGTERHTGR
jgi:hypothetical protein